MTEKINWGILGTGKIADTFASALGKLPAAAITAVGSRTIEKARQFGYKFNIPNIHGSYEDLVNDPAVDVIYVSTPHSFHQENTLLALEAGKHVLCEKPFAINSEQIETMITKAEEKKLFRMEAMWMWFFPGIQEVKKLIEQGTIGDIRWMNANFGFHVPFDAKSRLFAPELGGGALLDIGIYPLALSLYLFGKPIEMSSRAFFGESGVDEQLHLHLKYEGD